MIANAADPVATAIFFGMVAVVLILMEILRRS